MVSQAERRAATVAAILKAAEKEFGARGFEATTIDDIGARAGVAKGAVYHHFRSKEEIFEQVLDSLLIGIAEETSKAAAKGRDLLDGMIIGTEKYLESATAPGVRQILLLDGPAVLGWNKWRELDQKHFGQNFEMALDQQLNLRFSKTEIRALFHLLSGAVMEAALVAAASGEPKKKARELLAGIRLLLAGLDLKSGK